MPYIAFDKHEDLTYKKLNKLFSILTSYKITKVIDQPTEHIVEYDKKQFRGNSNTCIIPNKLYCAETDKVIFTDFIDISLDFFPDVIEILKEFFPTIFAYVEREGINSVTLKPCFNLIRNKLNGFDSKIEETYGTTKVILKPEYSPYLDSVIVAELIRQFYIGEQDKIKGFLIYRSTLKYLKLLFEEKLTCRDIINNILNTTTVIDVNDNFSGTESRFIFKTFKNNILITTKKDPYLKRLDLKYLHRFEKICRRLDATRFGRR